MHEATTIPTLTSDTSENLTAAALRAESWFGEPFLAPDEAPLQALADESRHILEEGVVAEAADIDTCLILDAGFPFWLGGITKHLDQTGVSERIVGKPLAEVSSTPS